MQDFIYFVPANANILGCYAWASRIACDSTESARLEMNRDQPSNQINYTTIGFKKLRAPKNLWDPIISFYERNKLHEVDESWPKGNTYVNNWELPTTMISFEDKNLREGWSVKQQIWNAAKPVLEEWTGKKLTETSLYGIRVYKNGAVLATRT